MSFSAADPHFSGKWDGRVSHSFHRRLKVSKVGAAERNKRMKKGDKVKRRATAEGTQLLV